MMREIPRGSARPSYSTYIRIANLSDIKPRVVQDGNVLVSMLQFHFMESSSHGLAGLLEMIGAVKAIG